MARRKPARKGRVRRKSTAAWKIRLLGVLIFMAAFFAASGAVYYTGGANNFAEAMDRTSGALSSVAAKPTEPGDSFVAYVVRVVDGDTILVRTGGEEERVRLLRVDTPESVHADAKKNHPLGKEASDFANQRLTGRQVRLESPANNSHDQYGRRLAYVFADGVNFNVTLVREGWSPYLTKYGRSKEYDREFRAAEAEAKASKLGIWSDRDYLRSVGLEP